MSPLADLFVCLRFFSRLPVPPAAEAGDHRLGELADAAAMAPVAGSIIGVLPCLVLLGTLGVGLPGALAAPLAIAALAALTGALHEDGLADCADGFGGGRTPERKLEIMRDSRIGTFGACAVALSLYLRAGALGTVAVREPMLACAALIAAASLSRALCLMPLALLPPARGDGLGKAAGRPVAATLVAATILAVVIVASASTAGATIGELTTAVALPAILALSVTSLAWRQIGGQTGDVAGAVQQIAEIAVLMVFASG